MSTHALSKPCVIGEGLRQNCHRGTVGCYVDHPEACHLPPVGWWCSRGADHKGPCAARNAKTDEVRRG